MKMPALFVLQQLLLMLPLSELGRAVVDNLAHTVRDRQGSSMDPNLDDARLEALIAGWVHQPPLRMEPTWPPWLCVLARLIKEHQQTLLAQIREVLPGPAAEKGGIN